MPSVKIRVEALQEGEEAQNNIQTSQEKKKVAAMTLLAHQAIANGKKVLNYSIGNIGNFTGDYTKTEGIQFALGVVNDIASIGVGAATSPIGLGIAVVGVALSRTMEAVTYFQDIRHKDIESEYLLSRSGNSLLNGSRGTEN